MLVNAKPPSEQDTGEQNKRHPLEAEIDALMKRVDPVPERVVSAARHAFDRRARTSPDEGEHANRRDADGCEMS